MKHGLRILFAGFLTMLTACSAIETERRPISQSPREQPMPAPKPPAALAAAPSGAPALWPMNAPAIYAQSAILIDADTGQTLFQKNADVQRQVASTQKLLTAILVVENGSLEDQVIIQGSDAAVEPTCVGVRPGQVYPRRQLLTAMMVKSCNDAAAALARDTGGTQENFVAMMNARARELGAFSSYFRNPHGLPASQYSTARDMARIATRAYRSADLRSMMRLPSYTFVFSNGRTKYLEATNKLLGRAPGVDGMKTGFTNAAGRCLISSASLNGRNYIFVQLRSRTTYIFNDADRMFQWAAGQSSGFLASR